MDSGLLRIVDANLNRAGEGLRLLEDVARLLLNDAPLAQRLKTMRHELLRAEWPFSQRLVQSRDAEGDVGADMGVPGERPEKELPTLVLANARRVQEALRVLEEVAKLPADDRALDHARFKKARFELYAIEQRLLARLRRRDRAAGLKGLYAIIDSQALGGRSHLEIAEGLIRGGASAIQLRDKRRGGAELLAIALELKALCTKHEVLFIVNDRLEIALATGADGLHLGPGDLPVAVARRLLPLEALLGCSVKTPEQALAAEAAGADYVAVGSMYPTSSKDGAVVVGTERLRQVRQVAGVPLVAIGGINQDNAAEVIAAGADAVAVIGALLSARDIEAATRRLDAALRVKT